MPAERLIRMLVVDDSALYRLAIRNALEAIPGVEIVGVAKDGTEALEKIEALAPDLLTLDVEMPGLDGIGVLREVNRRELGVKSIMVSSHTARGARTTTDALLEGAFDFIRKPTGLDGAANRGLLEVELAEKIEAFRLAADAEGSVRRSRIAVPKQGASTTQGIGLPCRAVVIGVSTGGPAALRRVLPALPAGLPVPVLVVQHMPPQYTAALAGRLDGLSELSVSEASDGCDLRAGKVLLAAGGRHMRLARTGGRVVTRSSHDPPEHGCRPAVDYLLRSVVEVFGGEVLAVILTGMGCDGLAGCRLVREHGGSVFAQHPTGCVVYGMPKVVIESGIADRVLPLGRIAPAIVSHIEKTTTQTGDSRR